MRQEEQGRTILEMLAVMVVMALLAILSISWFRGTIVRQEADRDYEDIQLVVSAVRNRGTTRTDSGMADAFLSYKKTRSGKNLFKLDNCPQNTKGMTIRVDDIDDKTCERLMQKKWDGPFKSLLFLRAESGQNVCSWNGTDGAGLYQLNTPEDCVKSGAPEKGAFAVVFTPNSGAICADGYEYNDSTYRCDRNCGEERYIVEGEECADCPNHAICDGKNFVCEDGYYLDDGVCVACAPHVATCTDADTPTACEEGFGINGELCTKLCETNTDCDDCEICNANGFCETTCSSGQTCVFRPDGRQRIADRKMCCTTEQIINGNCCTSVKYDETTGEKLCCPTTDTTACCPEGSFWAQASKACYPCSYPNNLQVNSTNYCAVCENRYVNGLRCDPSCPEETTIFNGSCYCPDEKPIQGHTDRKCHTCSDNKQGVWSIRTFALLNDGPSNLTLCRPAAYCGNYRCQGGYVMPCGNGKIGGIYDWNRPSQNVNFYLNDGTRPGSYPTQCYDCADVNISTIKFESQCNICGGVWSGENWYTGTCGCDEGYYLNAGQCTACPNDISGLTTAQREQCVTPVEYLESTGTQYIDTGFVVEETGKIETAIQINSTYLGRDFKLFGSVDNNKVGMCMNIFQGKYRGTTVPVSASKTEIQIVRGTSAATASISYDGNTYNVSSFWHSNPAKIDTFPIFAGTDTQPNANTTINKCPYKCYYFKQYDLNGTLVRDFIPVLDPNGVPAMYDKVEKKLYYNAGTGTFSYGPVVN